MDSEKIIQFVTNNLSNEVERKEVLDWIKKDEANRQFYFDVKNAYSLTRKSTGKVDIEKEYLQLRKKIFPPQKFLQVFFKYAAIIIIVSSLTVLFQKIYEGAEDQTNELFCPAGQIAELTLSDGTKIWLNSETRIKYPTSFTSKNRSVKLEGEAFFEVKKDPENPFIVQTETMNVKVTGTSFNVEAYNNSLFKTTLVEGRVALENKLKDGTIHLLPGQMGTYDTKDKKVILSTVDTRIYSTWKEGKMSFFNEPLGSIALKLERWYNVRITFASDDLKSYRFTSTILKSKPLDQILDIMKMSSSIDYRIKVNSEGRNEILLTKQNEPCL